MLPAAGSLVQRSSAACYRAHHVCVPLYHGLLRAPGLCSRQIVIPSPAQPPSAAGSAPVVEDESQYGFDFDQHPAVTPVAVPAVRAASLLSIPPAATKRRPRGAGASKQQQQQQGQPGAAAAPSASTSGSRGGGAVAPVASEAGPGPMQPKSRGEGSRLGGKLGQQQRYSDSTQWGQPELDESTPYDAPAPTAQAWQPAEPSPAELAQLLQDPSQGFVGAYDRHWGGQDNGGSAHSAAGSRQRGQQGERHERGGAGSQQQYQDQQGAGGGWGQQQAQQWWQLPHEAAASQAPPDVRRVSESLSPLRGEGASFEAAGSARVTLFVKGLDGRAPEHLTRAALAAAFGGVGRVVQVRLPSVAAAGGARELRGIAFVVFSHPGEKEAASALQGVCVLGRRLHLDVDPDAQGGDWRVAGGAGGRRQLGRDAAVPPAPTSDMQQQQPQQQQWAGNTRSIGGEQAAAGLPAKAAAAPKAAAPKQVAGAGAGAGVGVGPSKASKQAQGQQGQGKQLSGAARAGPAAPKPAPAPAPVPPPAASQPAQPTQPPGTATSTAAPKRKGRYLA